MTKGWQAREAPKGRSGDGPARLLGPIEGFMALREPGWTEPFQFYGALDEDARAAFANPLTNGLSRTSSKNLNAFRVKLDKYSLARLSGSSPASNQPERLTNFLVATY
jgi:hypothetical protein